MIRQRLHKVTARQFLETVFTLVGVSGVAFALYIGWSGVNWQSETIASDIWELIATSADLLLSLGAIIVSLVGYAASRRASGRPLDQLIFQEPPAGQKSYNWQRSRKNFLTNVRQTWIKGFLKHAVHREIFIALDMEYQRDAVARPWNLQIIPANETVPQAKSIVDVYEENGRSLLILGEPASGKTITLLQLCDALLDVAEKDETAPLPVVLNLSSWGREQMPLAEWVVEEILTQYQVPRPVAREWQKTQQLTLLLDGLDEVALQARNDCIAAINDYLAASPTELVVCSRIADYDRLEAQLNLQIAVRIQALETHQIDAYLVQFGHRLDNLRAEIVDGSELAKLAESPLMLSLMPIAYSEATPDTIPAESSLDQQRHHLLTQYVDRVFRQRPLPENIPFSQTQALTWLTNLAFGMYRHAQSIFYIERLQPTWLPQHLRSRNRLIYRMLIWLLFGLVVGLVGWLNVGSLVGLVSGLVAGLLAGLSEDNIELPDILLWSPSPPRQQFSSFARWFLLIGFGGVIMGLSSEYELGLLESLGVGAIAGLVIGLLVGLFIGLDAGLVIGFFSGLVSGLIGGLIGGLSGGLMGGLSGGLVVGLIGGLVIVLIEESFKTDEIQQRTVPNESIRQATRNIALFVVVGLVGGFIFALILWRVNGQLGPLRNATYFVLGGGWPAALLLGMPSGFFFGILMAYPFGLETIFKHYSLRFLVARADILPFPFRDSRLVAYLDAMVHVILLRRVGGGWVFIHRYLLEYFAARHPDFVRPEEQNQAQEK